MALSICTLGIGGNRVAGTKTSSNGSSEASHISAPFKTALNKFEDLDPTNSSQEEDFGGNSKSRNNLAIEPIV